MPDSDTSPNLIWIFGDQHRGQALSCMGDPNLSTPHLDSMAVDGMTFTRATAGFPLCCPFRGSLVTSRYPHRAVVGHLYPLDPELPTVAHAFKAGGYHTVYVGKWHLDGFKEREGRAAMHIVPPERRGGFDEWAGYDNNNAQYDSWVHGGAGDEAFHYRLPGYETDGLTDLLIDALRRTSRARSEGRGKPLFAVLSVQPPHDPYLAPPEFMARHRPANVRLRPNVPPIARIEAQSRRELAGYYAQIENLDWNVGRIRHALVETGLDRDTYLVFFSDHGDQHGSHGFTRKMCPYAESVGIPMIISGGPSRYAMKTGRTDVPMNHVDIAPTSLGLAGLEVPAWMEGADLSGCVLKGRDVPDVDSAYMQVVEPTYHSPSIGAKWRGIVTRDGWKYVCLPGTPWMMFNTEEDPYELHNMALVERYRAQRKRLNVRLRRWVEETGDEFDLPDV